ncbi:hypothetical protein M408DRAFT_28449 [Serendipita vermifera MAFF 305830]|uniref:Uncharacterized protein n=1 Tax=Serendipita vermifera MAFF 305830 TaxID=933852 RepID=A0A0C2WZU2_SERVB|nr:hypothetical protein M408DRAFT_28449 [Serendipita vermifera MAFF 305830]
MALWVAFVFGVLSLHGVVAQKLTNHSIDDTDPMISYTGSWDPPYTSTIDYGGTHALGTKADSKAIFTFVGVGVYFVAPMLPHPLDCWIQLDGQPPEYVNMTHPRLSVVSTILWSAAELGNKRHELVITSGTAGYVYVDGFMYTSSSGDVEPLPISTPSTAILAISISTSITSILIIALLLFIFIRKRRVARLKAALSPFEHVDKSQSISTIETEGSKTTLCKSKGPLSVPQSTPAVAVVPPNIGHNSKGTRITSTPITNMRQVPNLQLSSRHEPPVRLPGALLQRRWSDQSLGISSQPLTGHRAPVGINDPPPLYST